MKQKDIALILVVCFVSAIFSLLISSKVFVSPKAQQQNVEVVQPIVASFPTPDTRYFNSNSINPTQLIQIGNNNSTTPFNGTGQ
jgi:hypothetical protein